jgi:hypothetical protein
MALTCDAHKQSNCGGAIDCEIDQSVNSSERHDPERPLVIDSFVESHLILSSLRRVN